MTLLELLLKLNKTSDKILVISYKEFEIRLPVNRVKLSIENAVCIFDLKDTGCVNIVFSVDAEVNIINSDSFTVQSLDNMLYLMSIRQEIVVNFF